MSRASLIAGLVLVGAGLGGCALSPSGAPLLATPAAWTASAPAARMAWPDPDWWRGFRSRELDGLIAQAQAANLDLAAAAARLLQAEAQVRVANAALLPTLGGSGSGTRSGSNDSAANAFRLTGTASYELDLWGLNRADREAARAAGRASAYDLETAAITVTASTADLYLQILSLRERLALARLNVSVAARVLGLAEARVRSGAAGALDLAQQRAVIAGQRATIPPLEQREREAKAALALLLGRLPQGFDVKARSLRAIARPPVRAGVPSGLLARRPDVRRAEAQLQAADANIAAARAAFLPSIQLTGSSGLASTALSSLLHGGSAVFSGGLSIAGPIFDGGRLAGQHDAAVARREEIVANYRAAALAAFSNVDVALGSIGALARQESLQAEQVEQGRIAFGLAETRYREGADNLLTVLDAQRSLYSSQDNLIQTRLARLQAVIALYRALGGGWQDGASEAGAAAHVRASLTAR